MNILSIMLLLFIFKIWSSSFITIPFKVNHNMHHDHNPKNHVNISTLTKTCFKKFSQNEWTCFKELKIIDIFLLYLILFKIIIIQIKFWTIFYILFYNYHIHHLDTLKRKNCNLNKEVHNTHLKRFPNECTYFEELKIIFTLSHPFQHFYRSKRV